MPTLSLLMCHWLRVYAFNRSKCDQQHRSQPDSYADESNPQTRTNKPHSTQQLVCHKYTCPSITSNLDRSQDFWLNKVTALDDLGSSVGINSLTVGFEEFRHVEFRSSENLDLSDVDVVQWVDTLDVSGGSSSHTETYLGGFLDLSANGLGNKLGNQLLQLGSLGLTTHDLGHLAPDGLDLGRLSVGGLLDLVGGSLGETNGEESESVSVGGVDINVSLDKGLPFSDNGS